MAVKGKADKRQTVGEGKVTFGGRHLVIGANVTLMIAVAVALLVFVQWTGFKYVSAKKDMTSTGVNSVTPGTEKLFRGLDQKVWLTSLYFKTDLEEEDQAKYRGAVADLLSLLQGLNRSKVEVEMINPLQDREKREKLFARLKGLKTYQDESKEHKAFVQRYAEKLSGQIAKACAENEQRILGLLNSDPTLKSSPEAHRMIQQLAMFFRQYARRVDDVRGAVEELAAQELPEYMPAINAIKDLYSGFSEQVGAVVKFADSATAKIEGLGGETKSFLASLKDQLSPIAEQLKKEKEKGDKLETPKLEEILRELRGETRNQVVVETENEAKVISFSDTWPMANSDRMRGRSGFADRRFNGEAVIASAVLGLVHKDKAAVIFTRFGGSNPFFGGMPGMPQQQGPTYRELKDQLEGANFTVHDWDVSSKKTLPKIDPAPSRRIFLVLRPTSPPPPNPMTRRPPQQPQFDDASREAILKAIKDSGRALFLAGWKRPAGPMGFAMGSDYDFKDYLKNTWGLEVLQSNVVMNAFSYEPGKWAFRQNDAFSIGNDKYQVASHELSGTLKTLPASFFEAVPLKITDPVPEGVKLTKLVTVPNSEDVWGEGNFQELVTEIRQKNYTRKKKNDISGPFPLVVLGTKGDSKVVVVGSEGFATDRIANAKSFFMGADGRMMIRSLNPANVPFLVNCCHWLNDNTEFLDVGRPVEVSRLEIAKGGVLSFWHAFSWGVWPAIALVCGGGVWLNRRR